MAHPFAGHRQNAVEHKRVSHITKGYASGGSVHSDEAEDKAMVKRMVKKTALRATGGKVVARADRPQRASGGRVKNKPVNVIVNVAPSKDEGVAGAPPIPPGPPPMPPGPPMPPPPGAGGPPPGMPPMPPPGVRSSGGRAYKSGGRVKRADGGFIDKVKKEVKQTLTEPYIINMDPIGQAYRFTKRLGDKKRETQETQEKAERETSGYKRGGSVFEEGKREGTKVSHTDSKQIVKDNMDRPKPITYKRGGPINASATGQHGPNFKAGARGGKARLAKERRASKNYAKPIKQSKT
jgi:hypothetical protein